MNSQYTMDRHTQALKKDVFALKNNIERIYTITSALYQEIHEIKKHMGVDKDQFPNNVKNVNVNQNRSNIGRQVEQVEQSDESPVDILDNLESYAESLPRRGGRKVIDN